MIGKLLLDPVDICKYGRNEEIDLFCRIEKINRNEILSWAENCCCLCKQPVDQAYSKNTAKPDKRRMNMNSKKRGLKAGLVVLIVIALIVAGGLLFLLFGQDIKDVQIRDIEIDKLPNAIYTGELTGSRFGNKLEVTVREGRIVDIRIVKDMAIAIPELSADLFNKVMAKQSLQIDSVSGATVSTKAYLKSLEMALDGE